MKTSNKKRKGGGEVKQTNRRVKKRKYALVGEDWGLEREQEEVTSMTTKIRTPGEVQRVSWERRPLAIAWDGLKVLAIEWEGTRVGVRGWVEDPCTTLPVDRVNCVNPSKTKSNFVKKVRSVRRVNDDDAIVENEVKKVLSMRTKFENKPEDKTVGKVKRRTWTKLNNGLFGWKTTTVKAEQTTSSIRKKLGQSMPLKSKFFGPAIRGEQSQKISTGSSPLKRKFQAGIIVRGQSSESDDLERD